MPHIPPPLAAVGAAVAQRALSGGAPPPGRGRTAVTATITLMSGSMAASAAARFRRSGTTLDPLQPDRAAVLVTSGANTISRNPMYLGLSGLLLAHAVWRGSWAALLPVIGFVALIDRTQVPVEEAALLEKFGAAYEAYQAHSPRWIDQRSLSRLQRLLDPQRF